MDQNRMANDEVPPKASPLETDEGDEGTPGGRGTEAQVKDRDTKKFTEAGKESERDANPE